VSEENQNDSKNDKAARLTAAIDSLFDHLELKAAQKHEKNQKLFDVLASRANHKTNAEDT